MRSRERAGQRWPRPELASASQRGGLVESSDGLPRRREHHRPGHLRRAHWREGDSGAGRAAAGLRVRLLPRLPARGDRPRGGRRGRAGADADRRWQVAVLPDPGAGPRRRRRGDLAADRVDAGPGGRADRGRGPGRFPQLHPRSGHPSAGRGGVRGRRDRPALPRAGSAGQPGHAEPAGAGPDQPVRHRRGALRVAVGARLPAGLPEPVDAARALAGGAAHRADRHRHQRHPGRDRHPALADRGAALRGQLRPAQHPVPDRAEAGAAQAVARPAARRASRRCRDRLLPVPRLGGEDRRVPGRQRRRRAAVPRRSGRARPAPRTSSGSCAPTAW